MRKFGPSQLYSVEDQVNQIADLLVHVGFEVGVEADEQNWDAKDVSDMSEVLARMLDAERQLASAVGTMRAYEVFRQSQAVVA